MVWKEKNLEAGKSNKECFSSLFFYTAEFLFQVKVRPYEMKQIKAELHCPGPGSRTRVMPYLMRDPLVKS